jgi:archaellum component FlaG (FlaF/FlaG flagellin family)
LGEVVPGIRAFNISREQKKLNTEAARKALAQNWPNTPDLAVGEFSGFSPYAFLHRRHYTWNPTEAQKKLAFENLPYIKKNNFIHQKKDSRNPTVFTFVRKPSYYVTFNSGPQLRPQQRYGIGLLWYPAAGSFLQSQTGSDTAAWGTKSKGILYEADTLNASFLLNVRPFIPQPGNHDLEKGTLTVSYALSNSGKKSITFKEESIDIYIDHPGNFTEHLPLLLNTGGSISIIAAGEVQLKKPGATLHIFFDAAAKPEIKETVLRSGSQRVAVLIIGAVDKLKYSFVLKSGKN